MADPLAQAAQQFAPAPPSGTNFLDPTLGRNVISRYGQARQLGADLEGVMRLDSLSQRSRMDRMRANEFEAAAPLRGMQRDEEMKALFDKRDARNARVGVIEEFSLLDPKDPEYANRRTEIMKALPQGLLESDDVLSDIISSKDEIFEQEEGLRRDLQLKQAQQDKEIAVLRERFVQKAGGTGLPAEAFESIVAKHTGPDGVLNQRAFDFDLGRAAALAESGVKLDEFKAKEEIKQGNALERINAYRDPKERAAAIEDFQKGAVQKLKTRPAAFPSQMDSVRIGYAASELGDKATGTKEDIRTLMKRDGITSMKDFDERLDPLAAEEATRWDSDQELNEFEAARSRPLEEYVELVPDLDDRERQAREELWIAANEAWDAPAEEPAAAPAAAPAAPGAATGGKTLDQETAMEFFRQAGGDRDKARQLARDAGYGF